MTKNQQKFMARKALPIFAYSWLFLAYLRIALSIFTYSQISTNLLCFLRHFFLLFLAYFCLFFSVRPVIVEHPFFINFVKELNAGYDLPTREYLAGQLLERELAQINSKVKSEIEKESNLTLGLLNYSI